MKQILAILSIVLFSFSSKAQKEVTVKWYDWKKLPPTVSTELKKIKDGATATGNLYKTIVQLIKEDPSETTVTIGVVDMDKDGKMEYAVKMEGSSWCGSHGCSWDVYKDYGKKQIHLTDYGVKFVSNGVISSAGLLFKFE